MTAITDPLYPNLTLNPDLGDITAHPLNTPTMQAIPKRLAITFHPVLKAQFDDWAKDCRLTPHSLRRISKVAIRNRHHQAVIDHESHQARNRQPNIYTLDMGHFLMYYTVEPQAAVIRGYGWEIDRDPLDDFDGGGLFSEYYWR